MNINIICEGNGVILHQVQATDAPLLAQWKNEPLIREMAVGWDVDITSENQEKDILGSLENPHELYAMVTIKGCKAYWAGFSKIAQQGSVVIMRKELEQKVTK